MILGKVQARDNTEGLQIIIDGEEEPTTKKYHYLASYVPSAGDRILIEEIGDSYVVIGKVIDNYANAGIARSASTATTAGSADEATKATKDASNNTITSSYAASMSISGQTVTLKSKSGATLSTVTIPTPAKVDGLYNYKQTTTTVYLGVLSNTLYWSTSKNGPWYKVTGTQ